MVAPLAAGLAGLCGAQALSGRTAPPPGAALQGHVSGSAFLVAPGLLVTNAHVVLRCREAGLPMQVAGQPGPWRVVAEAAVTDLALLAGPAGAADAPLPLSAAQRLARGMPVLAMGYPAQHPVQPGRGTLQASPGTLRRAALTVHAPEGGQAVSFTLTDRAGREMEASWEDGLRYFGADKAERLRWRLEIDAALAGGQSGGPVLDAAGNVVGVVYAGGPQGSSAVPLADLRDFLRQAGVAPLLRNPPGGAPADWEAVRRRAGEAMRQVAC
ncbi:serine protease [Pseudoroseomonas cervicalis]|uniref:S1 family peptidase n=1 Tax=Teichococcus cervicalis TaxID=204525 RepID=UPI0027D78D19|nr:serine protease [Pseudoroseomonas cervicalis]